MHLSPRQRIRLEIQRALVERFVPRGGTMLDVGTEVGLSASSLRDWFEAIDGVEAHKPTLRAAEVAGVYERIYHSEALPFLRDTERKWDLVLAAEIVEHHTWGDGLQLLEMAADRARKLAIVTSPVGYMQQGALEGNPYQVHRSGWTHEVLDRMGWTTFAVLPENPSLFVSYLVKG